MLNKAFYYLNDLNACPLIGGSDPEGSLHLYGGLGRTALYNLPGTLQSHIS